ncbi:MAG: CPBP family intramembrane metalloprotease [Candidatus Marsarchaeota archaeon]|nr:CPBP family intramembrane metalloprotease [Candidatus Marsarchaeota archaeon]MCL5413257.1 CPBP family intramembrane metalloprotease [Candidatus Marsarchaeota archaeon]
MPKPGKKQGISADIRSLLVFILIFVMIQLVFSAVLGLAYDAGYIGHTSLIFMSYAGTSLSFPITVIAYLSAYKRMSSKKILTSLGYGRKGMLRNIGIGILIFIAILTLEILVNVAGYTTNIQIHTNVSNVFSGAPVWFYIFIAVIAPINEETLFRGFMVPRLGILPSAILFGLAHYSYMSTFGVEVIFAFIFAVIAGYVFKKTKSIYPGIAAHMLVNMLGVIAMFG